MLVYQPSAEPRAPRTEEVRAIAREFIENALVANDAAAVTARLSALLDGPLPQPGMPLGAAELRYAAGTSFDGGGHGKLP